MSDSKSTMEEIKDQFQTRKDAIKEDLKHPDYKNNKVNNVIDDLTKDKDEVKVGTIGESVKNTAIDGYEATKDALSNAAQYVSETVSEWTGDSTKQ